MIVNVPQSAIDSVSTDLQNTDSEKVDVMTTDDDQDKDQILALLNRDNSDNDKTISKDGSEGEMGNDSSTENSGAEKQSPSSGVNAIVKDTSAGQVSSSTNTSTGSIVLENNPKVTQVRKTGIVSEFSNELGALGLNQEQTIMFEGLSSETRKFL